MDEFDFRAALDPESQIMRPGALAPPTRAFAVFSQRATVQFPMEELRVQAARFFQTTLAATVEKRYPVTFAADAQDAIQLLAAHGGQRAHTRFVFGRAASAADHADARRAEGAGGGGLADLAQRCGVMWLVECTSDRDGHALRIAAILASVALGPIVLPDAARICGVKGARALLETACFDDAERSGASG